MTRLALAGGVLALLAIALAAVLWGLSGAWQHGDLPTGGLVRVGLFALGAAACHATAAVLWRRD